MLFVTGTLAAVKLSRPETPTDPHHVLRLKALVRREVLHVVQLRHIHIVRVHPKAGMVGFCTAFAG